MIKKNTKIIFENRRFEDIAGGIPLSKGEIIKVHEKGEVVEYEVISKDIDFFLEKGDQVANIVYTVKKRS